VAGVTPVSGLCRSCRVPATFNKVSVGRLRCLRRLGPPALKMLAGCWRSRPFGRSRPPRPGVTVISRTLAGRWLCPWPTQIVIPMTLAPETGEVSWDSMGLQWVLFLAEVDSYPSESRGFSFGWKAIHLEVKSRGVLPAVSGHAGSETEPAGGCLMATSWRQAPRDLFSRGLDPGATCPRAAASRPVGSGPPIFCSNRDGC
jgi:hypothetical protein